MIYTYKRKVDFPYAQAIERVKLALHEEGFGVITEIDVKATLKKKLDVAYDDYMILGACNPSFAYQALQAEKDIGVMLPCNVIVYVDNGKTYVACILPTAQLSKVGNRKLNPLAEEVEQKLKRVVDAL